MKNNKMNRRYRFAGFLTIGILLMTGCGKNMQDVQNAAEDQPMQTEQNMEEGQSAQEIQDVGEAQTVRELTEHADMADEKDDTGIGEINTLEGKKLSVLGDSISTYDGWIPEGYAGFYPQYGTLTSVEQTWWMALVSDTDMEFCGNSSSAGSTCSGDSTSTDDPKFACSGYRIQELTGDHGEYPDIIIVYMGTNDLLEGIPLGTNDGYGIVEEGVITNFSDAYCLILDKLIALYPAAQIFCCGLPQIGDWGTDQPFETFVNGKGLTSVDYNQCIEQIAETKGCSYISLYDCGMVPENMPEYVLDGVHFTPEGMLLIKEKIEAGLYDYFPAS